MSTNPHTVYMLKPSGNSIAINRTIAVIGEGDGPFVVLVTDRDYQDDPSGQTQTIVFRESYGSINDAKIRDGSTGRAVFERRLYS